MQLLRFPINLFLYKQLQFTWIEWINFIEASLHWQILFLKMFFLKAPRKFMIPACGKLLGPTLDNPKEGACLVVTLQENLVALQETCIALQEIRIDFKSQYQNWVSEMIGSLSDCFWQLLAPLALHVLAQLTPLRQIKVCLIGSN